MGLLEAAKQYLRDAMPGGLLNAEWTPERLKTAGGLLADFTPVVGGLKGAAEEWKAGNPGWAAFNAATVPLDLASMGLGGAALKGGAMALAGMTRPKYLESLVDVLKSGKAADVTFGAVSPRNEQRVNALRQVLDQPLIQRGDRWVIPQNVVQKLIDKRMGAEGMSAEKVADTLNSAVHSTRNRVFQSEYPQIQGVFTPKEEFSNLGFVGVNPRTGEPVIKSGYKLETDRANTAMNKKNSLWAGRSSAIAKADESASYRSAIPEHTGNMGSMPQPAYAPQYQAALDAGLDMSYEARMQRAAQQGYEPLFHGTNSDVAAFTQVNGGNMWGRGTYLTDSADDASKYATGWHNRITPDGNAGPNVMPLMARGRFLDMDAAVKAKDITALSKLSDLPLNDYLFSTKGRDVVQALNEQTMEGANHWLQMAKFDGLKGAGSNTPAGGSGSVQAVFNPANIRSVNAAFNPANIGKADLLGRINPLMLPLLAGGGLLGGAYLNQDK